MFFLLHCTYLHKYRLELELTVWLLQALRCILDSPLNKAGMVGAIYVKMDQRGVFEVKPHVRIPRTCNRFCGVISKLSYHFLLPFFLFYFQLLFVVWVISSCILKLMLYYSRIASKNCGVISSSSCCWGTYNTPFACQLSHSRWVIMFESLQTFCIFILSYLAVVFEVCMAWCRSLLYFRKVGWHRGICLSLDQWFESCFCGMF